MSPQHHVTVEHRDDGIALTIATDDLALVQVVTLNEAQFCRLRQSMNGIDVDNDRREAEPVNDVTEPGWYLLDDGMIGEYRGDGIQGRVVATWNEIREFLPDGATVGDLKHAHDGPAGSLSAVYLQIQLDPELDEEEEEDEPEDLDCTTGDVDTSILIRSRTHHGAVEVRIEYPAGSVRTTYGIRYKATNGSAQWFTGDWSTNRKLAISRLRKLIADGHVMPRKRKLEATR